MGSCLQLSIFSGSSCFCWLCPSCCLPLWVPMPKATVMYQLNPTDTSMDTATTATLCLMVTSQDTVTMAMQHPMDMSPEPDMDTMATLYLMSQMQHPMDTSPEPDMDIMATLYLMSQMQHPMVMSQEPDMDTMATLYLMVTSQDTVTMAMQHPMDMSPATDMGTTAIL